MVQDAGNFTKQSADVLGSFGNLNVEKLLDSEGEALLVCHHGNVVEAVKVGQGLEIRLVLDELLGTAVQQTDVGVGTDNFFAIELENQSQHTVSGRMLGSKVDGVVADLAVLDGVLARLSALAALAVLARQAVNVVIGGKVFAGRNESRTDVLGRGILSKTGRREWAGSEGRAEAQPLRTLRCESLEGGHDGTGARKRPGDGGAGMGKGADVKASRKECFSRRSLTLAVSG